MPFTPDSWSRAKEILSDALELEPQARSTFVAQRCAGDPELRREIEALLAAAVPPPADPGSASVLSAATMGPVLKGRYAIQRKLEQGGFSTTFLAVDRQLNDRRVVIKVMDSVNHEPYLLRKFQEELAALSSLEHPNIIAPLDSGELSDGARYIVMQFAEGKTLRMILNDGTVPLPRAGALLLQLGRTLGFIHSRKIYHRDLKPENVIIQTFADGTDHVRLIDFGIASIAGADSVAKTRVIGTLNYMAPEQLRGEVGPASDLYSLGVIAYELITGTRPFDAASLVEHIEMQRNGPNVRPGSLRAGLDPGAESLVLQALEYQPSRRPQDAARFAEALGSALQVEPQPGRSVPSKARYAIGAACALALVAGALWLRHAQLAIPQGGQSTPRVAAYPAQTTPSQTTTSDGHAANELTVRILRREKQGPPGRNGDGVVRLNRDDEFRLEIATQKPGHLYLFSIDETGGSPPHVLFPSPNSRSGSSAIPGGGPAQVPDKSWLWFGPHAGYETLLLVWSPDERPELENAIRWANPHNRGRLEPSDTLDAVKVLLGRAENAAWKGDGWHILTAGSASAYRLRIFHS